MKSFPTHLIFVVNVVETFMLNIRFLKRPVPVDTINEKIHRLGFIFRRVVKYKDYLFSLLHYSNVPADNNGSERAIRNIKVKQKISGQFKSFHGAMNFAILRSITDSAIKNGQIVFKALFVVAELGVTD